MFAQHPVNPLLLIAVLLIYLTPQDRECSEKKVIELLLHTIKEGKKAVRKTAQKWAGCK